MPPNVEEGILDVETEPAALKRQSVHGAAVSLIGQGFRILLQFGAQLYMAHLISPTAFGLVAMIAPILRFIQLFNTMGLLEAVIQRPSITHRELSSLFWVNLTGSVVLALVFAALAPLAAWLYGEPRLPEVMLTMCMILVVGGLSAQPMALLNRKMRFLPLTLIDIISTLSAAVVGIGMATLGFGYWALVGMQLANSVTLCMLAWFFAGWRPSWPHWEPGIVPLLGFGGHITAFGVLGFFSESFDRVLLGVAAGSLALGLYDRSATLVLMPMVLVMGTFTRVAVPLLSRLIDVVERYRRSYLRVLQTTLLLTTPGLLCVILVPDCVILTLLGHDWIGAVPIIRPLATGALVHPIIGSAAWLFVSQDRADQQLLWGSIGFAAIATSFVAGLPWGPVGVASAWATCSWLIQAPLILWASTRRGPVRIHDVLKACAPVAAAAVFTSLILLFVRARIDIDTTGELVFALVLSYGMHAVMLTMVPGGKHFLRDALALRSTLSGASP